MRNGVYTYDGGGGLRVATLISKTARRAGAPRAQRSCGKRATRPDRLLPSEKRKQFDRRQAGSLKIRNYSVHVPIKLFDYWRILKPILLSKSMRRCRWIVCYIDCYGSDSVRCTILYRDYNSSDHSKRFLTLVSSRFRADPIYFSTP